MAHSKNRFVEKQDETVVEVDVPGKDLKVLIPDNRYAYGDNESVAQMAQDVVGKHSNDQGAKVHTNRLESSLRLLTLSS